MTPEETSLARLLVALPGWRWVPSMTAIDKDGARWLVYLGHPPILCGQGIGHGGYVGGWESSAPIFLSPVPDLHDPATAGILLGMLWAADPNAGWHVHGPPGLYCVHRADGSDEHYGDHLGVAVARALVAIGRCA